MYVLQINKNNAAQSVDQIEAIIRSIASAESIEDHVEIRNLFGALKHHKKLVEMEEPRNHGLIDVDCFILETYS